MKEYLGMKYRLETFVRGKKSVVVAVLPPENPEVHEDEFVETRIFDDFVIHFDGRIFRENLSNLFYPVGYRQVMRLEKKVENKVKDYIRDRVDSKIRNDFVDESSDPDES